MGKLFTNCLNTDFQHKTFINLSRYKYTDGIVLVLCLNNQN